jgi:hypothetical protein
MEKEAEGMGGLGIIEYWRPKIPISGKSSCEVDFMKPYFPKK